MGDTRVHGYHVVYDDDTYDAMKYLRDRMDNDESRVYFDEARRRGFAKFETEYHHNFTLNYSSDGTFTLEVRK